ncbi:MAG: hypothetical protein WA885_02480 [Phormidesmis sp.]
MTILTVTILTVTILTVTILQLTPQCIGLLAISILFDFESEVL